jgi:hypothetical protein
MRAPLLTLLFLLTCAAAYAQELDIFDPTDFVDPRERGAIFRPGGFGITDPGAPFSIVRAYTGRVTDYQWRNAPTDADLSFLHLTSSRYWGDHQLNLKLTAFHADQNAQLPSLRGTVQFGRYFGQYFRLRGDDTNADVEKRRIAGRVLFTVSTEKNPFLGDQSAVRRDEYNHEFGMEMDVRLPLLHARKIDGSFIWMRRRVDKNAYTDRFSYLYRLHERTRSNGRLHLNMDVGIGAERANGWHCCVTRAALTARFVIPLFDTGVNVSYAPTYSPAGADGRRTHHELAIYLDRTVFAHLADMPK